MTAPGHKWRRAGRSGNAVIETALMAPWIFFLFVGVLDFGFYAYALISIESATRVAALNTAQSSAVIGSLAACGYVQQELNSMPNAASFASDCSALPLIVSRTSSTGPDGSLASSVTVQYQTVPLVPIPGLLAGQLTFTRTVEMRVIGG